MKIPATDPLCAAALKLARATIDKRDPKAGFIHARGAEFSFDLTSDGVMLIKALDAGSGKISLSMAGFFSVKPIISVKAPQRRVSFGPKSLPMADRTVKTEDFTLLAAAKVKAYRQKHAETL